VTELRSQARSIGRSSDLSTEGCYVDTLSTFGVGVAVHVRLERDMHEFEAQAVVINTQMSMGMGWRSRTFGLSLKPSCEPGSLC